MFYGSYFGAGGAAGGGSSVVPAEANHYRTLISQIRADLRTIFGEEFDVQFGRPRRMMAAYPHAVVLSRIRRSNGIRDVTERYEFRIGVKLALPDPYPEDGGDAHVMDSAASLTYLLAPFDEDSPQTPAGAYAGIGTRRYVTEIEPLETMDQDKWIGFQLTFSCDCTVYQ